MKIKSIIMVRVGSFNFNYGWGWQFHNPLRFELASPAINAASQKQPTALSIIKGTTHLLLGCSALFFACRPIVSYLLYPEMSPPHDVPYAIPPQTCSAFGSYPNPLQLTATDRALFHPVVKFGAPAQVLDFTQPRKTIELATEEQRLASSRDGGSLDSLPQAVRERLTVQDDHTYCIGRYDENRVNLYESDLFDDTENAIEDFKGQRTLHMGIDLDGPVGTPVFAFYEGVVHAVGKNEALGDYGNVIVIEHRLPDNDTFKKGRRLCYALYGHLDDALSEKFRKGVSVATGQCIGHCGAIHENGGWFIPHVHFQLSLTAPVTHDLPGAVAMADRARALVEYPDPRYVLGELY
jgi:murein DD-endopeptidase MepM/ murein hydrolase activator NlpD